jgi:hypothetical protein
MPVARLRAGDRTHGVVEAQAEDLDMEVNGVAGQITLGPAPAVGLHLFLVWAKYLAKI